MESKFQLPLDLNKNSNLKAFLIALYESEVSENLIKNQQNLPEVAKQIIAMLNDDNFKNTSKDLADKFLKTRKGQYDIVDLKNDGANFHNYLTTNYPLGYKRLQETGNDEAKRILMTTDSDPVTDVAFAVQAVTAAAAWANVAAVTNAVVALEAVVSIGVVAVVV